MKTDREIITSFVEQVKDLAEKLADEGKGQEYVDLLFRLGFVVGKAMKSLDKDE